MSAYHVERLTPGGVVVEHYDTKLDTDGPWLVVHAEPGDAPSLIVPAHAVVSVTPCWRTTSCPLKEARRGV